MDQASHWPRELDAVGNRTLAGLLEKRFRETPGETAVTFVDRTQRVAERITFAELDRRSASVAGWLESTGIRRGDTVAVHLPNIPEFLYCWFGIARLGAVMVATNLKSAPDEMEYYLTHSEAKVLVTHPEHLEGVEPALPRCPGLKTVALTGPPGPGGHLSFDGVLARPPEFTRPELGPLDTCAVLYTSGTTSRPKGVMITQGNYVWAAEVMVRTQSLTRDDRYLVCLPYFHINAQSYSTVPVFAAGGSIVLMERFTKTRFWDVVAETRPTVASFVPALTKMLYLEPPGPQDRQHGFRLWGGGARATGLEKRFGVRTIGWFGMTETISVPVATSPLDAGRNGAIGWVNTGYRVRILDEGGRPCGPGETGEIEVWGVPGISLMKGYLKNPEATAETISPDGWLKTGDNVVADEDGYITYVNRKKDMLKVGGENVAASEIERVAMTHPAVSEAAAIGIPDRILGEVPKLVVILNAGFGPCEQELIDWCRGRLASFKVPREVEFRDELPRATLEKVAKKTLIAEDRAKRAAKTGQAGTV